MGADPDGHPRTLSLHAAEGTGTFNHFTWADGIVLAGEKTEELQSMGNELNAVVQRADLSFAHHKLRLWPSRRPAAITIAGTTLHSDDDQAVLGMSFISGGPPA